MEQFPSSAFAELALHENERVKALCAAGIVRHIWKRGDMGGAAIVWEAAAEAEVREAIGSLPIYQAGMLEIIALVPREPYPRFAD
jgi:muconolactone delta-isomerase